jgi:hypothetical protein
MHAVPLAPDRQQVRPQRGQGRHDMQLEPIPPIAAPSRLQMRTEMVGQHTADQLAVRSDHQADARIQRTRVERPAAQQAALNLVQMSL